MVRRVVRHWQRRCASIEPYTVSTSKTLDCREQTARCLPMGCFVMRSLQPFDSTVTRSATTRGSSCARCNERQIRFNILGTCVLFLLSSNNRLTLASAPTIAHSTAKKALFLSMQPIRAVITGWTCPRLLISKSHRCMPATRSKNKTKWQFRLQTKFPCRP